MGLLNGGPALMCGTGGPITFQYDLPWIVDGGASTPSLGVKGSRAGQQYALGLGVVRIGNAAIDRAHCGACFVIMKTDTFGALGGNDVIDILRDSRARLPIEFPFHTAAVYRRVWAFWLASTAVDAFARYSGRHSLTPA